MTDSPWFSSPAYFLSSLVSLSVYFAPHLPDCPDFFHLCWTGTASVVVLPVCCCCHRLQCYQWSDCSVWEPAWTVSRFSFYYLDVSSKHCTCTPNVSFLNTHPRSLRINSTAPPAGSRWVTAFKSRSMWFMFHLIHYSKSLKNQLLHEGVIKTTWNYPQYIHLVIILQRRSDGDVIFLSARSALSFSVTGINKANEYGLEIEQKCFTCKGSATIPLSDPGC